MSKRAVVTAVVNQKGGTGKTTTCENLGIGLAAEGKKVLLVDTDPQASLTISLGYPQPDNLSATLSDLMLKTLNDEPLPAEEGILHHAEGVDLIPANIELAGMEVSLVNAMSRERTLDRCLDSVRYKYDNILLDCMPSLGMLTVNALAASDNVLIPVQAQYLSAKGLEQLLQTVNRVKRQINPKLKIDGILLTMVDGRTNYNKEIADLIRETYGKKLKVFDTVIPRSVRAAEISAEGKSIYAHDPKGKVAAAYRALTEEVLHNSDFILMLNQASGDRQILAKQLGISQRQLEHVTQIPEGEGLLFYGSVILPFVDHFPQDTQLYRTMTTKLSEVTAAPGKEA